MRVFKGAIIVLEQRGIKPSIHELIAMHAGIHLDIGCGGNKQPGYIGLDIRDLPDVDIIWDIEEFPWPLPDECVKVSIASHIVEHINPHGGTFLKFMDEVWRITMFQGTIAIAAPHGASPGYMQDPTHCNQISEATFAYFDPLEPNIKDYLYHVYQPKPWEILSLSWSPVGNIEVLLRKRRDDPSYHS